MSEFIEKDLILQEYQKLNTEMRDMQIESSKLEKIWIVVAASLYSWILLNIINYTLLISISVSLIPFILALLIHYRIKGFGEKITIIAEYIRNIETQFAPKGLGYEHYILEKRSGNEFKKYGKSINAYFYIQIILSIFIPVLIVIISVLA